MLEEKRDGGSEDDTSDSKHEDHENADETNESHVMDRLLGIKSRSKEEAPGIREVEEG